MGVCFLIIESNLHLFIVVIVLLGFIFDVLFPVFYLPLVFVSVLLLPSLPLEITFFTESLKYAFHLYS